MDTASLSSPPLAFCYFCFILLFNLFMLWVLIDEKLSFFPMLALVFVDVAGGQTRGCLTLTSEVGTGWEEEAVARWRAASWA